MTTKIKKNDPLSELDINHADGSKSYMNIDGTYIHIERPEVVKFIEDILKTHKKGYRYMIKLDRAWRAGILTTDEYRKVVRILD